MKQEEAEAEAEAEEEDVEMMGSVSEGIRDICIHRPETVRGDPGATGLVGFTDASRVASDALLNLSWSENNPNSS